MTRQMPYRILIAGLIAVLMSTFFSGSANAAAYVKSVYAPEKSGDTAIGWADVNADCADTFGCYIHVKVEYLNTSDLLIVKSWEYAGGGWAKDGWNKVTVELQHGCTYYRTVVDSYNDAPGDAILGVNLGIIEVNLGSGVNRYHMSSVSSSAYLCRYA